MNLRALVIYLEEDGFRIDNPERDIPDGTPLLLFFETSNGWETREVAFYPRHRSLFHPFTKDGMFIYAGEEPTRVVIKAVDGDLPIQSGVVQRQTYVGRNFYSFPDHNDSLWDDDLLRGIIYYNVTTGCDSYDESSPLPQAAEIETPGPFAERMVFATQSDTIQPPPLPQDDGRPVAVSASDEGIDEGDQPMYPETANTAWNDPAAADSTGDTTSDPNAY